MLSQFNLKGDIMTVGCSFRAYDTDCRHSQEEDDQFLKRKQLMQRLAKSMVWVRRKSDEKQKPIYVAVQKRPFIPLILEQKPNFIYYLSR